MTPAELARDAARIVRERPAVAVGAGVLALIALRAINRDEPADEPAADPYATTYEGPGAGPFGSSLGDINYTPGPTEPPPFPPIGPPVIIPPDPGPPPAPPPAPAPDAYRFYIQGGATIRVYDVAGSPGCIRSWQDVTWGPERSSAPCTKTYRLRTCDGGGYATVTTVTAGRFAGKVVRSYSHGVNVAPE